MKYNYFSYKHHEDVIPKFYKFKYNKQFKVFYKLYNF